MAANPYIDQFRGELGDEYKDYSDHQLAQALHHQYQTETGETTSFESFAKDLDFTAFDESTDELRPTTGMTPATAGLEQTPDFSQKIGAQELETLQLPDDPWIDVLQKNVERLPERAKQLGGALMDITSPAIDPLFGKREEHEGVTRVASQKIWTEAEKKIRENQPQLKHGTAKYYASAIFNATADMSFAVAASAITKNPNIGLAVMTSQVFVDKKAQSLSEGKSEDRANLDAVFYSMTEGLTEKVPLGILTKEGGKWLSRTLKSMGAEGLQEVFAESAQIGYERGIWDEGEELSLGQMAQRLWDAGIIGMGTGGALAVITQPMTDSPEKALGREMLTMVEQVNLAVDDMDTATKFAPPQNNAQAVFQQAVKDTPQAKPVAQEDITEKAPEEVDQGATEDLSGLWAQYDDTGEIQTHMDLVDEVEAVIDDAESSEAVTDLSLAVSKYRQEQIEDEELGGRGDMDSAETAFNDALLTFIESKKIKQATEAAPIEKASRESIKEAVEEKPEVIASKEDIIEKTEPKEQLITEKEINGETRWFVDDTLYMTEKAAKKAAGIIEDPVIEEKPIPEAPKVAEPAKKTRKQEVSHDDGFVAGEFTDPNSKAVFETGKPVTFKYIHNTESSPNMGKTFQQDIDPAGRYLNAASERTKSEGTFETGNVEFKSPLVLMWNTTEKGGYDENSWKARLSKKYNGLTGKKLSQAIVNDGYDGIVTIDTQGRYNHASEIVDLTGFKAVKKPTTGKATAERKERIAKKKPKKRDDGTQASRTGDIQSVWAPGATYVPMLRGRAISDIEEEVAKVPDKPIRREHIIKKMERLFGVKIYKGRVKGKTRLGFFRASNSEIRTKLHNDLEVTAHEVTHWLDDRYKEFARAYKRKPFKQELLGISYDVDNIKEGFAEFGRLYMTQEHEAVLRAPLFYDKFVSIMESEGIRDNVDDIKDSMHQWYNQGALGRFRSKIGKDVEPIRQRIAAATDGFSDTAIASTFDALHGIKVAEADLLGTIGAADLSPYKSTRLVAGSRAVTKVVLERGTIAFNENGDVEYTGKGLRQVFEPVADIFEDTMMYFAARRASELMKQGREHHFEEAEIKAALKLAEENPIMKDVFDEYQAFNDRMMDFYQQSGLLSNDSRKAMEEMNKDYVPFFRIQEEITGDIVTRRTPFKRLTGGTANVDDIFDNITFGTATLIREALLNRAKQRTYSMLDNAKGGAKYAVKIPTDIKMTEIERVQVEDAFLKGLGLNAKDYRKAQKMHMSDPSIDQMLEMITGNLSDFVGFFTFGHAPQGNNIDSVMIDGKRVFYEVADPLFMKAMNSLGAKPMHLALRIGAGFKNTLTRGVTSMPDFQMVNLMRDSFNGFVLSEGGITPLISSLQGAYEKIIKDDAYWEFMANGGGYSSTVHGETQATRRHLEHLYNSHGIDYKTVLDTPQKMMDMWDEFTSAFEYGTRLAEYKAMRKKGATKQEAAFQGREISTDFAMRGYSDFLRVFTTTVPFLNARMQGLYKLEREAFEKGGKQARVGENAARLAMRGLGAITLPSLLLYLLNKDDERYTSLPEWVKDLHWVILIPGKEDAYLIPKPFENGAVFATIPERMLQLYIEKKGRRFEDSMFRILKDTFNLDPTPQIIKPLVETEATNRKFTGAPIIPEDLKGIEAWEQYRPYTAESMVALGKETGLSPMKMEHLVRGYFGTLGMYLLMGADGLINDQRDGEAPTKRLDQMPIVRRWIRQQPYRGTSYSDQFYKVAEETRKITKTFGKIRKEGRANDLNKYLGEGNRELLFGLDAAVSDFVGELSSINGAIRQARTDTNKKPDEKRKEIDNLLETRNKIFKAASEVLDLDEIKNLKRRVKDFE